MRLFSFCSYSIVVTLNFLNFNFLGNRVIQDVSLFRSFLYTTPGHCTLVTGSGQQLYQSDYSNCIYT